MRPTAERNDACPHGGQAFRSSQLSIAQRCTSRVERGRSEFAGSEGRCVGTVTRIRGRRGSAPCRRVGSLSDGWRHIARTWRPDLWSSRSPQVRRQKREGEAGRCNSRATRHHASAWRQRDARPTTPVTWPACARGPLSRRDLYRCLTPQLKLQASQLKRAQRAIDRLSASAFVSRCGARNCI